VLLAVLLENAGTARWLKLSLCEDDGQLVTPVRLVPAR
jgi:hypothetical protein